MSTKATWEAMERAWGAEERQLADDLREGLISGADYNIQLRALQREQREEARALYPNHGGLS